MLPYHFEIEMAVIFSSNDVGPSSTKRWPYMIFHFNNKMGILHKVDSIRIRMGKDNKVLVADIATRFLPDHQVIHQQMDLPRSNGRQTRHHKMAFFDYTLSYLPHLYAYITSYAKMRACEWASVL